MSNNAFDELAFDLKALKKSRVSLADGMQRLDSVSGALRQVSYIEKVLKDLKEQVDILMRGSESYITNSVMEKTFEEYITSAERKFASLFENYITKIEDKISDVVLQREFNERLNEKVNKEYVKKLDGRVNELTMQIDTLTNSYFESFKTDIRQKLMRKVDISQFGLIEGKVDSLNEL